MKFDEIKVYKFNYFQIYIRKGIWLERFK